MSDFGAEVIKIERPSGDLWRSFKHITGAAKSDENWPWILTNRNKKSVALDLENPDGREALLRLVRTADVFVTTYHASLLKKFRLTWDELRPLNQRSCNPH